MKKRTAKNTIFHGALPKVLAFVFLMFLVTTGMIASRGLKGGFAREVDAVTDDSFQKEVVDSKLPVLVDFWATWCGPCRMYGPIVDQLAKDYQGRLKVVRVDIDRNPRLAQNFQIISIPDSILFQNGKVVKTWVGLVSEDDLKGTVDGIVAPVPPQGSKI